MHIAGLGKLKSKTAGLVKRIRRVFPLGNKTSDRVDLNLWGLNMSVKRDTALDTPVELSVIIPRAEVRHKYTASPEPSTETEIIFSGITVVLSPRHPSEQAPAPSPPVPVPSLHFKGGVRAAKY